MIPIKSVIYKFYRYVKVRINYLLDRVIDLCNIVLMDAYRFPWPAAQNTAHVIARYAGDVSWLLRDFPRLSAYKLIGADWTIIFVGRDVGLREICHLFFEEEVDQQELGRIALWKLSAQTQQWLTEGADLVVCELSRIHPRPPKAAFTFTVPTWIQQTLTIPEPLEALLAGKKFATQRHRLNKAKRAGFNYRFSQSKADFDYFHYQMYLPYVKARHGHLALIAPYQDQWWWFARGGLVLVTQHDKPVAGVLCYMANDTCFDVGRGVLESDPQLFKQGIETIITWYAINWAGDQGAKIYDMGGIPHAWRSDGAFNSKRSWGARVVRRKRIYGVWTFLAQNLPPSLQDHINRLGFISETDGKFCSILLNDDTPFVEETDIHNELLAAQREGLAGLAVISPNAKLAIYDSAG